MVSADFYIQITYCNFEFHNFVYITNVENSVEKVKNSHCTVNAKIENRTTMRFQNVENP